MSGPAEEALGAYRARFPTESGPVLEAGTSLRCAAVLCDDMGRVLQHKVGRVWQFPTEAVSDADASLAAVATRALRTQMGILDAVAEGEPIDVSERDDVLIVSYRFTGGGRPVPASVAVAARWSPYDTIRNERLGAKLAKL